VEQSLLFDVHSTLAEVDEKQKEKEEE